MKLTVLIDNNTIIDRYFLAEPGVSYFIEEENKNILFDVGYSNAFILNAQKLHIDLFNVDFITLSHGHLDHTWGLFPLIQLYTEALIENLYIKKPTLITHPLTFLNRKIGPLSEIGSLISEEKVTDHFIVKFSKEPIYITEKLIFLGEIEKTNKFESQNPIGKVRLDNNEIDDFIIDDSAIAYKSPDGLVIITGCSHAGICNIIDYAKKVCDDDRIIDIIGGFHLLNPSKEQLQGTIKYMNSLNPRSVHACHCTDLHSKIELSRVVNLLEVGVGLEIEY